MPQVEAVDHGRRGVRPFRVGRRQGASLWTAFDCRLDLVGAEQVAEARTVGPRLPLMRRVIVAAERLSGEASGPGRLTA